jgi:hypothetical protein
MREQFHILWPENRLLCAEKSLGCYRDAVANGEIDGPENPAGASPEFAAKMLDHAVITLANGRWMK